MNCYSQNCRAIFIFSFLVWPLLFCFAGCQSYPTVALKSENFPSPDSGMLIDHSLSTIGIAEHGALAMVESDNAQKSLFKSPLPPPPNLTKRRLSLRSEVVESDVGFIIDLDFAPDGRLFYSQLNGEIYTKVLDFKAIEKSPSSKLLLKLAVALSYESGLLGLALSPDFAQDHHFFVYYALPNAEGKPLKGRIVRYKEANNRATEETIIVDNLPFRPDQNYHFGGGLSFGPDGKLYLIFGDTNLPRQAPNPHTLPGSILRYNPDGSIPDDNPFPGSPAYAYGIRNGYGLTWHPKTELLYATENGTTCDDELNLIELGQNYGWGMHAYDKCPYPDTKGRAPLYQMNPIIAPAGLMFYTGKIIPELNGDLLICGFNTLSLYHFRLSSNGRQVKSAEILDIPWVDYACRVAIIQGPDGWLYTTTDNTLMRLGR